MNMRLIGATSISELNPDLLDTRGLGTHSTAGPQDHLSTVVYDPLITPSLTTSPNPELLKTPPSKL